MAFCFVLVLEKIEILGRARFAFLIDNLADGFVLQVGIFFLQNLKRSLGRILTFQFSEALADLKIAHTFFSEQIMFDEKLKDGIRYVGFKGILHHVTPPIN